MHQVQGRLGDAEAAYEKGLVSGEAAIRTARWVGFGHYTLAMIYQNLAVLRMAKSHKQAEELFQKGLELCRRLTRRHPGLPRYGRLLAEIHESMAHLYLRDGRPDKAESHLREAIASHLAGTAGPLLNSTRLGTDYNALGLIMMQSERPKEAAVELNKAMDVLQPLVRQQPPERLPAVTLARTLWMLGYLNQQQDNRKEALDYYARTIVLLEAAKQQAPLTADEVALLEVAQAGRAELLPPSNPKTPQSK
jgi:tetratricopeptide (TPR) repeat protein